MEVKNFNVDNIPAILWGKGSKNLFIAVHGDMSHKADDIIVQFASKAQAMGYQTLSFDLPEHGDRQDSSYPCLVQNCVNDLKTIKNFAESISDNLSLFGCSLGVYFSLLAYKSTRLNQSLFLSPIVDMLEVIENIMSYCKISKGRLESEKIIETSIGHTLNWDYYSYVKSNPITIWNSDTSILYGSKDDISNFKTISEFSEKFNCKVQILENGEHFFHTPAQLQFFNQWLNFRIRA